MNGDEGADQRKPSGDEAMVGVRFPERAEEALRAVIGHEPTPALVDLAATTLAAWEGSQQEHGEAYLEALELAARTGMPTDPALIKAVVQANQPLPSPTEDDEVAASALLHHTLRLTADEVAQKRLPRRS